MGVLPIRQSLAHLSGKVAQTLTDNTGTLFDQPTIEPVEVVAEKPPTWSWLASSEQRSEVVSCTRMVVVNYNVERSVCAAVAAP
jgi:hypothetical protein